MNYARETGRFRPLFGIESTLVCEISDEIDIFLPFAEDDAIGQLRSVQNELNEQGASDLVVELLISQSSSHILEESIHLAIALLEGGNSQVQVSFVRSLTSRFSDLPAL